MTHKNDRVLSVKELSRVEGEGALYLRASGNRVEEARLDIYEPPRFFEAFLRGRAYTEPPLRRALDDALATAAWVAGFDFPDHRCQVDLLALSRPGTRSPWSSTRSGSSGPSGRTRARSTVSWWTGRAPQRATQPARTASASATRSPWP